MEGKNVYFVSCETVEQQHQYTVRDTKQMHYLVMRSEKTKGWLAGKREQHLKVQWKPQVIMG
jgi:hypothetical protein